MPALERLGLDAGINPSGALSLTQAQTESTFSYKWSRRQSYDSEAFASATRQWLLERYCQGRPERLAEWLGPGPALLLDAGCGAGSAALQLFGELLRQHHYLGVDISDAVEVARERFAEAGMPGDFLRCDLNRLPLPEKSLDMILSEGVLHHTDSTRDALLRLSAFLKPDGWFLFYVYRRKGPIREFTDDWIRQSLQGLSDEEAWEALKPLSRLGQALAEKNVEIEVPEAIDFLGIPAGPIDLQRFFYWHVFKAYHRPEYSLEEMNHINFDWYRPLNCHRHTREEVVEFCQAARLSIRHLDEQPSGFTVVAQRTV